MVDATLAGCGLCQLLTWLVGEHLRQGRLVTVLDEFAGAEMPIHVLWPKSRYVLPKLRVVVDALVDAAAKPPVRVQLIECVSNAPGHTEPPSMPSRQVFSKSPWLERFLISLWMDSGSSIITL